MRYAQIYQTFLQFAAIFKMAAGGLDIYVIEVHGNISFEPGAITNSKVNNKKLNKQTNTKFCCWLLISFDQQYK